MPKKTIKETIHAKGIDILIYTEDFQNEYLSLTDIARYKSDEPYIVINNWMRGKDTIDFLGLWEQLHNPDFKPIEFDRFRSVMKTEYKQKKNCRLDLQFFFPFYNPHI